MSTTSVSSLDTACTASTDSCHISATSSPSNTPPPVPSRSLHTTVSHNLEDCTLVPGSLSSHSKHAAPGPPEQENLAEIHQNAQTKRTAPAPPSVEAFNSVIYDSKSKTPSKPASAEPSSGSSSVPKSMGAELIELVRKNTNLSYELSRVAIGVIVGHIQSTVPSTGPVMEQILISLIENKVRGFISGMIVSGVSYVARKHCCLFVVSCQNRCASLLNCRN